LEVYLGLFSKLLHLWYIDISTIQEILIATHFLFPGVEASFMLGALFQMLPVLAGVIIRVQQKSR